MIHLCVQQLADPNSQLDKVQQNIDLLSLVVRGRAITPSPTPPEENDSGEESGKENLPVEDYMDNIPPPPWEARNPVPRSSGSGGSNRNIPVPAPRNLRRPSPVPAPRPGESGSAHTTDESHGIRDDGSVRDGRGRPASASRVIHRQIAQV